MKFLRIFNVELIKLKKNYSIFMYFVFFQVGYMIYSFLIHLTRIQNTGNLLIPLNISYAGYIFYTGFSVSMFIIILLFDADIKDEISTGKMNFILTQTIDRKDYFLGKTLFWFLVSFVWILITLILSWIYSNVVFNNRLPLTIQKEFIPANLVFLNCLIEYLFLLPFIYILIVLSFYTGFFYSLESISIIFYTILLISTFIVNYAKIFFPFNNMRIYDNAIEHLNLIKIDSLIFFIITIIISLIIVFFTISRLEKREF